MSKDVNIWSTKRQNALVLEIVLGKTIAEIASKTYGVPLSQIEYWIKKCLWGKTEDVTLKPDPLNVQEIDSDQAGEKQSPTEHEIALLSEVREETSRRLDALHAGLEKVFPELNVRDELQEVKIWLEDEENAANLLLWEAMGCPVDDSVDELHFNAVVDKPDVSIIYLYPIAKSYAYWLESEQSEKQGDFTKALMWQARAVNFCSEAEADALTGYSATAELYRKRKGGITTAQKQHDFIKKDVIRLLHEKRPPNGWTSKKAAISEIENDIFAAHGKHLSWDNLDKVLSKWFDKDQAVRVAYEATKKP